MEKAACKKSSLMRKPESNFYGRHCLQKYDTVIIKKNKQ